MWEWGAGGGASTAIVLAVIGAVTGIVRISRWAGRIETALTAVTASIERLSQESGAMANELRNEMRDERTETRQTLDAILLRIGGLEPPRAHPEGADTGRT